MIAFHNPADKAARVLFLCVPSRGLDQMFAELQSATASGMPKVGEAIAAKYGNSVKLPAIKPSKL
jgi:hypothetical protein